MNFFEKHGRMSGKMYNLLPIGFIERRGKKEKELPLLEKVTITDVAAEGKAVAKVNELVIFVPYVVPAT